MKTVFVLVDALKSLYLTEDYMPFLFSLSQEGLYIKQIIPCAGFCERSEVFSGLDGYDTGNFTAIGYLPEDSPYAKDGIALKIAHLVSIVSERIARRLFSIWRLKKRKPLGNYRIPFKSLKLFSLTEDGHYQLVPHRDIFDELKEAGMAYSLDGFTALSDIGNRTHLTPIEFVKTELEKGTDFIPVYIGVIDSMGHRYGKNVDSIRPYLQDVDVQLKQMYEDAIASDYAFCILGDHGMVPVNKKLDLMRIIASTNCRLHKDYEVFYDSTMARFWFMNDNTSCVIRLCLEKNCSKYGIIVDSNNCKKYRVPLHLKNKKGNSVYGDLVWCANPGVLISPDYFHSAKEAENGMHGYIEVVEGHGTGVFVKSNSGEKMRQIEKAYSSVVCGELCKTLGIKIPNKK